MTSNALILQCGGPTAVINASLCGIISACQNHPGIQQLWGVRHGLRGLAGGDWADLTGYRDSAGEWQSRQRKLILLEFQPGAALGGGRDRLTEEDIPRILDRLQQHDIGVVFMIGGNGSMKAARKLSECARAAGYQVRGSPLRVIAIPKTIDNDIAGTDVCPGYGSAARFVAQSVHDVGLDLYAMREFDHVAVIEVMGRHVGWLAAAAALARWDNTAPPHLILVPEVSLDEDAFLVAVQRQYERERMCVVVAAEGIQDMQGTFLTERHQPAERDDSGQKLFGLAGGPSPYLATLIKQRLGLRCRQMRPDLMQRSSSAMSSEVDRNLARQVGEDAVTAAVEGRSDIMIGLERRGERWQSRPVPLGQVIGQERALPAPFISPANFDVTAEFIAYARPLLGQWSPGALRL
ncbi:MAG TPA: diphosphate--fructose-6-phosphate 1-phosphotransferase [Blastocatellia bacterium]|nr:diphosphate--fructose-6-phosphate 1-phosphotransferase [Blastocatellia bacterium]